MEYQFIPIRRGTWWKHIGTQTISGQSLENASEDELGTVVSVLRDTLLFNWQKVMFGPWMQGVIFEIAFDEKPIMNLKNGYLTVGSSSSLSHFHFCVINPQEFHRQEKTKEIDNNKVCSKIGFFSKEPKHENTILEYGIRFWNKKDEEMLTLFFPFPKLNADKKLIRFQNWTNIQLWNDLIIKYSGSSSNTIRASQIERFSLLKF